MKQKIVMKVSMHCQKCRSKAMKIAAAADGVNSVAVQGKDQDEVVVVGDGVDATNLAKCLRKKVGHTDLVSVEEVKTEKKEVPKEKKEEKAKPQLDQRCHPCPQFVGYEIIDEPSPCNCAIM